MNEETIHKRIQDLRNDLNNYIKEIGYKGKYMNAFNNECVTLLIMNELIHKDIQDEIK